MPTLEPFADLAARFRAHHNNSLNVALHMITTPAGVLAALILALQRPEISLEVVRGVVGAYVLSLAFILLRGGHLAAFFCTAATMAALTHAATALAPTLRHARHARGRRVLLPPALVAFAGIHPSER